MRPRYETREAEGRFKSVVYKNLIAPTFMLAASGAMSCP